WALKEQSPRTLTIPWFPSSPPWHFTGLDAPIVFLNSCRTDSLRTRPGNFITVLPSSPCQTGNRCHCHHRLLSSNSHPMNLRPKSLPSNVIPLKRRSLHFLKIPCVAAAGWNCLLSPLPRSHGKLGRKWICLQEYEYGTWYLELVFV